MSGDCCWPPKPRKVLLCVLSYGLQWYISVPDNAHEGLSPYPQQKEWKSLLSPSLANHWGDLHVLLDAVPGFPSGIVNPLPLLHGQRELLRSFSRDHSCSHTAPLQTESELPLPTDSHSMSRHCWAVVPTTTPSRSQGINVGAPGQCVHYQGVCHELQGTGVPPAGAPSGATAAEFSSQPQNHHNSPWA